MWSSFANGDNDERLGIINTKGQNLGKPLLAFITLATVYCAKAADNTDKTEFEKVIERMPNFCSQIDVVLGAVYYETYGLGEDQYGIFKQLYPKTKTSEQEFIQMVRQAEGAWTKIKELIPVIIAVSEVIRETKPAFIDLDHRTILEVFEAAENTLSLLATRGAKKVRISIS